MSGRAAVLLIIFLLLGSATVIQKGANQTAKGNAIAKNLDQGLVAYWDFDEGSGDTLHDRSGNGNDGTIHNATWVRGVNGHALSFDGVDDYVEVPDSDTLSIYDSSVTVALWFYFSDEVAPANFLIKESQYVAAYGYSLDHFVFRDNRGNGYTTPYDVVPNRWYFFVGEYDKDANIVRIFINGELIGSGLDSPWDASSSGGILTMAAGDIPNGGPTGSYFKGYLDEVRIYNRALSAEEVKELYYRYVPESPGNLQASMGRGWINLKWDKPENANSVGLGGYDVYRSTDGIYYVKIGEVQKEEFNDTSVEEGNTYYYYVVGKNSNGAEGNRSGILKINYVLPPTPPTHVSARYDDKSKTVVISWDAPMDDGGAYVEEYIIYRSEDGTHFKKIGTTTPYTKVYYDDDVEPGKTYYYYVTAANRVGESGRSSVAKITIPGFPWLLLIIAIVAAGAAVAIILVFLLKRGKNRKTDEESGMAVPPQTAYQQTGNQAQTVAMITVTCPYCGYTSQVPENMRGKWVQCPNCGNRFQIP